MYVVHYLQSIYLTFIFLGKTMKTSFCCSNVLHLNYVSLFVTWIKAETVHVHFNIVIVPFSYSNTGEAKTLFSILIFLYLCVQCRM